MESETNENVPEAVFEQRDRTESNQQSAGLFRNLKHTESSDKSHTPSKKQ